MEGCALFGGWENTRTGLKESKKALAEKNRPSKGGGVKQRARGEEMRRKPGKKHAWSRRDTSKKGRSTAKTRITEKKEI